MRSSLLAIALVVAGTLSLSSAPSGVAGDWMLTFNTPGGTREAAATFKVDGETLTGTMSSTAGETPLKGTVKDNAFTFTMEVVTQGGLLSISMKGEVDGDSLKGTMDFGQGTGDFTGKRKAQ